VVGILGLAPSVLTGFFIGLPIGMLGFFSAGFFSAGFLRVKRVGGFGAPESVSLGLLIF
jgi:hypothetical protein